MLNNIGNTRLKGTSGLCKTENGVRYDIANGSIMVSHENGYYGLICKCFVTIWYMSKEVLRTERTINTADELYKMLSMMPETTK